MGSLAVLGSLAAPSLALPDPVLLLKKLQYEEKEKEKQTKGKLKIFLGYAAGSGKTYAMLEAAHEAKKHQVDVVAGYIEPHARPDTQAMAEVLILFVKMEAVKQPREN